MRENAIKNTLVTLRSPAMVSLVLLVPFLVLEFVNRRSFNEGFPLPLFAILWLLPMGFIVLLKPIVHNIQGADGLRAHPVQLLVRGILLLIIAWLWTVILLDQMPCFLRVPICD